LLPSSLVFPLKGLELLSLFGCCIEHVRIEEVADLFIIVLQGLEDKEGGYYKEDFGIALFEKFSKLLVLLCCRLNNLGEMK
jgi:hypothetical protein